jgi:hypothetical protein
MSRKFRVDKLDKKYRQNFGRQSPYKSTTSKTTRLEGDSKMFIRIKVCEGRLSSFY